MKDLLPVALKSEMTGLDYTGVHRPDANLVNFFTFDAVKCIGLAVFHDEAAIRYSLLIVSVAGLVVAAGVFLSGLRAFRAAAASVESWNGGER